MKALDILNALIYEGCIPQVGTMNYDGTATLRDWFGATNHKGTVTNGTYFYLYAEDFSEMQKMPCPDVLVETEECGNVWLWRIDE